MIMPHKHDPGLYSRLGPGRPLSVVGHSADCNWQTAKLNGMYDTVYIVMSGMYIQVLVQTTHPAQPLRDLVKVHVRCQV